VITRKNVPTATIPITPTDITSISIHRQSFVLHSEVYSTITECFVSTLM